MIDENIPNNSHAINPNAQNIKKRSIDASDITEDIAKVTVSKLKKQVDDLVVNYNKLAKTLNRPQLHDTNSSDDTNTKHVKMIKRNTVSRFFVFFSRMSFFFCNKKNFFLM